MFTENQPSRNRTGTTGFIPWRSESILDDSVADDEESLQAGASVKGWAVPQPRRRVGLAGEGRAASRSFLKALEDEKISPTVPGRDTLALSVPSRKPA
jgi:hypothetical protein